MKKIIFGLFIANLFIGNTYAEPTLIPSEQLENYKLGVRLAYKSQTIFKNYSCGSHYSEEGNEYINNIIDFADSGWIDHEKQPLIILQTTLNDTHRKLYISTNPELTMITSIKVEHSILALANLGTMAKPDIQKVRKVTGQYTCIPQ
jgi:hypothetical protein